MPKNIKPKLIAFLILILFIAGAVRYVQYLMNQPLDIDLPTEFTYNGQKIALAWTDDNTGEDLIIQSDKKEYNGFSSVDVYFSITNINRRDQDMDVVVWVKDEEVRVEGMERLDTEGNSQTPLVIASPQAKQSREQQQSVNHGIASSHSATLRFAPRNDNKRKSINGFTTGYTVNDKIESGNTNYYKTTIKYPAKSKGEFFIEAFGHSVGTGHALFLQNGRFAYGHLDPWYSSSYQYKRVITLNADQIATTTSAFSVLATTTLADLKTITHGGKVTSDDGYDIIFVDDDDETLLNFEREYYASTTGEIAYWIKTDISSTTNKQIKMYYGNDGASDVATTTGVWDDNFVMVQHLQETDIDNDAGDIKDSTKYANDGTTYTMDTSDQVAGQIDGSLDFDGGNDRVRVADSASLDTLGDITFEFWFNPVEQTVYRLIHKNGAYSLYTTASKLQLHNYGDSSYAYSSISLTYDEWQYIIVSKSGGTVNFYRNNVLVNDDNTITAIFPNSAVDLFLGIDEDLSSYPFKGLIDEVRISNVARTAGWIETEYNNQVSVGDFMTFGAEEMEFCNTGADASDYTYYKAITLNNSQIATTSDAFTILATTTDAHLKTTANGGHVANSEPLDLVFFDENQSTLLNFEIEKYVPTTGELAVWIKTGISSTTDKTIYMYYGYSGATKSYQCPTGTWDDNYVMVNHLAHDGTATTTYPDFLDSTDNDNDGSSVNMNSDDLVDGQVDGALDFDGGDDYVDLGDKTSLEITGALTLTGWFKLNSDYTTKQALVANSDGAKAYYVLTFGFTNNKLEFWQKAAGPDIVSDTSISDNSLYFVAATRDGSAGNWTLKLYLNGDLDKTIITAVNQTGDANCATAIGRFGGYVTSYKWNGLIDEVRISNTARHAMDILTDYNNQSDVGSFMTFGAEKLVTPAYLGEAVDLSNGLVGHWKFSEGSGSAVADSSGEGNIGAWNGSGEHWTAEGRFGSGGEFDGVGDYVSAGDVYNGVKTIAFWIKADDITSRPILDMDGTDYIETDGSGNILATDFPDSKIYIDGTVSTLITSNWHFVVITDNTGVNGSAVNIGKVSASYFDGKIDEIRFYSRVLSQREIAQLYNNTKPTAEWHFRNNYNDKGGWCSLNNSCKNLTAGGSGNYFTTGFLEEVTTSLSLNGSGYANLADDSYFDIVSSADFSLISTLKSADTGDVAIISKRTDNAVGSEGWLFGLNYTQGDGIPYFEVSDGTNEFSVYGSESVNGNTWQTVGVVFDESSASGCKIYIDGQDKTGGTSGTIASVGSLANAVALNVGRTNDGNGLITAEIDRIGFFSFAMSLDDVLRESVGGHIVKIGHAESSPSTGSGYDPFGGQAPVAWWKLDEMSGSVAADYASSSLDGTWNGSGSSTWHANGKIGYGGKFNGSDDYVDVTDNNVLDATAITIEAWVKSDTVGRYIVAKDPPLINSPPEADQPLAGNNYKNVFKQEFSFSASPESLPPKREDSGGKPNTIWQKAIDFVKDGGRKLMRGLHSPAGLWSRYANTHEGDKMDGADLQNGSTAPAAAGDYGAVSEYHGAVSEKVSYNTDVMNLEDGKKKYKIHVGHINYKDKETNELEKIDTTLIPSDYGWTMDKASYHLEIPEYVDDWFRFVNDFEGEMNKDTKCPIGHLVSEETVSMKPLNVSHIKGELIKNDGWNKKKILYKNAFGDNIDLEVIAKNIGFDKLVVINEKPKDLSEDLEFSFEIDLDDYVVYTSPPAPLLNRRGETGEEDGLEVWDKDEILETSGRIILEKLKQTWFREFSVWDSEGNRGKIRVRLCKDTECPIGHSVSEGASQGRYIFTKIIDKEFLENAVYPVYTDDTVSYYAGAYDGTILASNASYTTAHDATSGSQVQWANNYSAIGQWLYFGTYYIFRGFFPFDTSAIGSDTITATILKLYGRGNSSTADFDIIIVEGLQGAVLELTDYNDYNTTSFGSINTNSFTTIDYNSISLNPTGIAGINKTGSTYFAVLSGEDLNSSQNTVNEYVEVYMSDYVGTDFDPYLEVTAIIPPKSDVPYALSTVGGGQFLIMNSGTTYTATGTTDINDSAWHHIVGSYDGTTMKIYIDGNLEDTNTDFSDNLPTNDGNVRIGADYQATPDNFFSGLIDDVKIYNYARTAAQIAWDYNKGKPAGHWKFDEASTGSAQGAALIDSSGNGNTGTGVDGANDSGLNWTTGKINYGIDFDGTDDYIDIGDTNYNINTISFWLKANSLTESIIDLDNGAHTALSTSGTISANGFSSPTIYVDGAVGSTIDTNWRHVTITTATAIDANNMDIGRVGASYFDGKIDDVRIYGYERTADQVREDYLNGARVRFGE